MLIKPHFHDQLCALRQASAFRKKLSPHPGSAPRISDPSTFRPSDLPFRIELFFVSITRVKEFGVDHLHFTILTRAMATLTLAPRLVRLTTPGHLSRPTVLSTRVFAARYSTNAEEEIIKVQQIPAPGSGHVRVLLLNRPKARNAISRQLLETLSKQVNSIAAENGNGPTRALVVASNVDAAFCAGADLKERAKMTQAE